MKKITLFIGALLLTAASHAQESSTEGKNLQKDNNFVNTPYISSTDQFSSNSKGDSASGASGGVDPASVATSIAPKPGSEDNDKAGIGLKSDEHINEQMGIMNSVVKDASCYAVTFKAVNYEQIAAAGKEYMANKKACVDRQDWAARACLEHLSPNILTGVTTLNTLLSAAGLVSVKDSCDGFANAMNLAKTAMTSYTAACGAMKAGCGLSCVSARKGLEGMQRSVPKGDPFTCTPNDATNAGLIKKCTELKEKYTAALNEMMKNVADEMNKGEKASVAGKASICTEKYAQLLTSGLTGIASLMNSIKQGKNCEEQSNGTAVAAAEMCKDPTKAKTEECLCKNPQSPECICVRNPATPGCSNNLQKPGESSDGSSIALGPTDKTNLTTGGGPDLGLDNKGAEMSERNPSSADGGSLPGAPNGGGAAGLGGGSGGGSGVAGPNEGAAKKGLDANILGGAGGGGGGAWGAFGGGSSDKYRAYLPGGAKDPSKGVAGQQAWTKEVTGQGGKSNWEKIKERYRDNKNSLLNN